MKTYNMHPARGDAPPVESIDEHLRNHLVSRGLFKDEASAVMSLVDTFVLGSDPDWIRRKTEPIADYPPALLSVLQITTRACAVRWIDENCPEHWAREMFA